MPHALEVCSLARRSCLYVALSGRHRAAGLGHCNAGIKYLLEASPKSHL